MSLTNVLSDEFRKIEKDNPREAKRISDKISGDIYGLYPTGTSYETNRKISVEFDQYGKMLMKPE